MTWVSAPFGILAESEFPQNSVKSNYISITINTALRGIFSNAAFDGFGIGGIAQANLDGSVATNLIDLISQISPHIILKDKNDAKMFPSEVHSQIIKSLAGNLKSLIANNFFRVLVVQVQNLL